MATFKVFLFLFSFQKFEYGVWCSCFCWVGAKVLSPQGWGQGSLPPGGSKSPVSIWFLWGERCSSPLGLEHAWGRGHFAAWVMRLGLAEQGCFICHFLSCWAVPVLVLWQKEQLLGFFFSIYVSISGLQTSLVSKYLQQKGNKAQDPLYIPVLGLRPRGP